MTESKEKLEIEEKIDRYVNGELSQKEIEDLWVELIQDDEYVDYLETTANLKHVVGEDKAAGNNTKIKRGWMYAAAASIVLLIAVFTTVELGYFDSSTEVQPIESIELDYYRSVNEAANLDDREQIIRDALNLFNEGRFDEAVNLLNNERDKASEPAWIARLDLTLGTLFYNTDKFNNAAYYFNDIIDNYQEQVSPLTLEKAYWYVGNSYFQMDMLSEAEAAMRKAYELNGAYSRVAKSYLDAMAQVRN